MMKFSESYGQLQNICAVKELAFVNALPLCWWIVLWGNEVQESALCAQVPSLWYLVIITIMHCLKNRKVVCAVISGTCEYVELHGNGS